MRKNKRVSITLDQSDYIEFSCYAISNGFAVRGAIRIALMQCIKRDGLRLAINEFAPTAERRTLESKEKT